MGLPEEPQCGQGFRLVQRPRSSAFSMRHPRSGSKKCLLPSRHALWMWRTGSPRATSPTDSCYEEQTRSGAAQRQRRSDPRGRPPPEQRRFQHRPPFVRDVHISRGRGVWCMRTHALRGWFRRRIIRIPVLRIGFKAF